MYLGLPAPQASGLLSWIAPPLSLKPQLGKRAALIASTTRRFCCPPGVPRWCQQPVPLPGRRFPFEYRSELVWQLLQGPAVRVRIAKGAYRIPPRSSTSPTSTPRSTSSARAASISESTRCRASCTQPGGVCTTPIPKAIEHAEPEGVSLATRLWSPTLGSVSALRSEEHTSELQSR